ncbi:hypothetical protein CIPAW_05G222200 [Carya illinoinensis]|uniref:Uncharacterized protein n=1 Tax=Carya illinoinensis TaxID=32201 RepID=A0A8T1QM24_CARIL|nr:hypothetical protein CIPAW_05G222200 [Carya illinoinensis]
MPSQGFGDLDEITEVLHYYAQLPKMALPSLQTC